MSWATFIAVMKRIHARFLLYIITTSELSYLRELVTMGLGAIVALADVVYYLLMRRLFVHINRTGLVSGAIGGGSLMTS